MTGVGYSRPFRCVKTPKAVTKLFSIFLRTSSLLTRAQGRGRIVVACVGGMEQRLEDCHHRGRSPVPTTSAMITPNLFSSISEKSK